MNIPQNIVKTITLTDGREIIIETGRLAKQADGSVIVKMGNAMLLATVVSAKEANEGVDFLPLTVSYQENYAAAGRFPGGFFKREGRLSNYEVLISRLIDRALRPLFPDDYHAETQVMVNLISADKDIMPDCLAGLAASAAIAVSDIPFNGPISEVRVAKINDEFVINPSIEIMKEAKLDLIVAGSAHDINMVEGEMDEVSEDDMLQAIKLAHDAIKVQVATLKELEAEVGKTQKREFDHEKHDGELEQKIKDLFRDNIYEIAITPTDKTERSEKLKALINDYLESLTEEEMENEDIIIRSFNEVKREVVRNIILKDRKRLDGRKLDEIRNIWMVTDYLPSAHGSAIFTRGETQALATATLGNKLDEQMIDGVMFEGFEKFYLHYNFPPFSTGEARMLRGPGRREVGHGNLAERALKMVLPEEEDNPYTIRVVSDVLESNGSSSMATVCAGCLALMDAGVKLRSHVAGIAMGLINDEKGNYAILSDILGDEDHLGDMDFKVAGTENGITACQMDLKVNGLSFEVLAEALEQAKQGRLHILGKMKEALPAPREDYKSIVPRIERFTVGKEYIGPIIGPGGRSIQAIQAETGTVITIDEVDNQGVVEITSKDQESMERAKKWILGIVEEPEVGKVYTGTVKNIMPFGAFIEFMPGRDGLLHISEVAWNKTESMEDVVKEGETIEVKLKGIDERSGKFSLTKKELLPKPEGYVERPPRKPGGRDGGHDRNKRHGHGGGRHHDNGNRKRRDG